MLQVFWYDIDFDEDPYQPQKRFDGNFERRSDSEPAKAQRTRGERPQRGVRSEYDAREPRQKFGGDLRSRSRSGSSEDYPRPARATPEASWRPAVRSRRNGEDEDDYYYEDEEEEFNRVRGGSDCSSSSDGGGKKRSRQMSTGEARKSEVALRLAELEEEAKELEEKTLACEEKLAVVNVNQALWGRRLQASGSDGDGGTCGNRDGSAGQTRGRGIHMLLQRSQTRRLCGQILFWSRVFLFHLFLIFSSFFPLFFHLSRSIRKL
jgi:hypothetical protein